jgi:predicted PurR-regulated permease PerM
VASSIDFNAESVSKPTASKDLKPGASRILIDATWPNIRVILRVVLVTLAVLYARDFLQKLGPVILLIVLSIFFAYLVSPVVEFLHRPRQFAKFRIALPRAVSIGLAYLLIFAAVTVAIYFVVPQLANQFPQFAQQAKNYSQTVSDKTKQLNGYFQQHQIPGSLTKTVNDAVPPLLARVTGFVETVVTALAGWVVFLPWLVLIPILSFFMLKDAESFRRSALQMLPRGRWRWRGDEFFQDVNSTLAAYTRAQLTACFFIGAVCAGGFAIIGLPSPLVLGLLAGLFEFVPLVGPVTVAIIATLASVFYSGFSMALIVLIFLLVLRILQDYFIYPRLIRQGVHLHPLLVIIAILSGAELAGVTGVFLAIPAVAIVTVSYRHWLEHRGSEGLADLIEGDLNAVAEDLSDLVPAEVTSVEADVRITSAEPEHPTAHTTPEDMARARPDLTTGELKLPTED